MKPVKILLLTQENCAFCDMAQDILQRLAGEFALFVSTQSLDTPEGQSLALQHGILFAPGLLIEGEAFSYGRPSERKLRRALEAYGLKPPS